MQSSSTRLIRCAGKIAGGLWLLTSALLSTAFGEEPPSTGLFHGQGYLQVLSMIVPDNERAFFLECWTRGVPVGTVTRTFVTTPLNDEEELAEDSRGAWWTDGFETVTERDAQYPTGSYQLTQELVGGGSRVIAISLSSGAAPAPPQFHDSIAWMSLPPMTAVDISWTSGAGTLPGDYFQLALETGLNERVFETPRPGHADALTGQTTSVRIPAEHFIPGSVYLMRLTLYRVGTTSVIHGYQTLSGNAVTTTAILMVQGSAMGQDVSAYRILLGRSFTQSGDQPPVEASTAPYVGEAWTWASAASVLNAVSITPAGMASRDLMTDDGGHTFLHRSAHATESALLADWPSDDYLWSFDGISGGMNEVTQSLSAAAWPEPLHVANWAELQSADPTGDIELHWLLPQDAAEEDRIELAIVNSAGETVHTTLWGIDGTNTFLVVPGGTLEGDSIYDVRLRYIRVLAEDTDSLLGATGLTGQFAETRFSFQTGEVILPPTPLLIVTTVLDEIAVGSLCNIQLALQGGVRPYVWSLAQGSLQGSFSLDPQLGTISGTPLAPGTFAFAVRVQDSAMNAATQALSLVVIGELARIEIVDSTLPPVVDGIPYLVEFGSAGGVLPVQWLLVGGELPPGLVLDGANGLLAGTPEASGAYEFELEIQDAAGQSERRVFSLTVPPLADDALRITGFEVSAGHPRLSLNAESDDPVSILASSDLKNWQPLLATNYPPDAPVQWQAAQSGEFYRARWGWESTPPNPRSVTPVLDGSTSVGMLLTAAGGSLVLTGAQGEVFQLDIPTNAISMDTPIQMTLVSSISDLPFTGGPVSAVELRPSGLYFLNAAQLTVTFPGGVPAGFTSFACGAGGSDLHLYPSLPDANSVIFPIFHFSHYGGAEARPGEAEGQKTEHSPCKGVYKGSQEIADLLRGRVEVPGPEALWPVMKRWYNESVWANLKAAQTDENRLEEAMAEFLAWASLLQWLGFSLDYDDLSKYGPSLQLEAATYYEKALSLVPRGFANAIIKLHIRAVQENNPWLIWDTIGSARTIHLLGMEGALSGFFKLDAIIERISRVYRFELQLESIIDVVVTGVNWVEQVRSQRAPIELDPGLISASAVRLLARRFSTNLDLVSFELVIEAPYRTVLTKGSLETVWLRLIPEWNEPERTDECPPPKPPEKPSNVRIHCGYRVFDPVQDYEVQAKDGTWIPSRHPLWKVIYKLLHYDEVTHVNDPYSGDEIEAISPNAAQWHYEGGEIFARASYTREMSEPGGKIREVTELMLRHAPKPLRPRDTVIPSH